MATTNLSFLRGGAFLISDEPAESVFTPEDFTEEHRMLRQSVQDFIDQEVEPRAEAFDSEEGHELSPRLLEKMGDLGFLGIGVPEAYGGFTSDFKTQLVFGEVAYSAWAFGLAVGVQTSLGIAPLLLYGNEQQKEKYLPGIVSARIKSCYCLTEPTAGSDANAGKSRALPTADGRHFILNGQKMWITGSGYADLFFVFAKIEDDPNLSCLIVEKSFGGIRLGEEEKKMGIKGSSTRQVFFENVKVPAENLLGERNQGFKIALNVLNTGRIKMATSVTANARHAFRLGLQYAQEREQFGRPIARFGAMQHKIAEMMARVYAMESIVYRIGGSIDKMHHHLLETGMDPLEAEHRSIAEFAMECAMAKVFNTEGVDFVVDESLQIHGGMGFSAEMPIETLYRNARINRIYEGTNEINRMLAVDMLLRKAMRNEVDLMRQAMAASTELQEGHILRAAAGEGPYGPARARLQDLKKAALILSGTVAQQFISNLREEQEILLHLADLFIEIYALESALLRSEKQPEAQSRQQIISLLLHRALRRVQAAGTEVILALDGHERSPLLLEGLRQLTLPEPINLKEIRRALAQAAAEKGDYLF